MFPNGLIIQWGVTPILREDLPSNSIAFPYIFPNKCMNVLLTIRNDNGDIFSNNWPQIISYNSSSFKWINQGVEGAKPSSATYFAIGY